MTKPYFLAKATECLKGLGAPKADPAPLAAWAEQTKNADARHVGVVVDRSGRIVAHTMHKSAGGRAGAYYVTSCPVDRTVEKSELGMSMGRLRRAAGADVAHVKAYEVTTGASAFIR